MTHGYATRKIATMIRSLCCAVVLAVTIYGLQACGGTLANVVWPATVQCSGTVTGALVDEIGKLVVNGPDTFTQDIEQLAVTNGAGIVTCVLGQLLTRLADAHPEINQATIVDSVAPPTPAQEQADRILKFLAAHGVSGV